MITLPGLIDPHTHPRGLPTDEYKEDFYTATAAALAGGFVTIGDMPNNPNTPTLTYDLMVEKQKIAKEKIFCDVGFYFGSTGENLDDFPKAAKISLGLKIFLSFSTGKLIINTKTFEKICVKWTTKLPILLHAEEETIKEALEITKQSGHQVHICHVSSKLELKQILDAKMKGYNVTCGVTPHHLFLNQESKSSWKVAGWNEVEAMTPSRWTSVKPSLKPQSDVDFLWQHLADIDIIESDHAPHTLEDKQNGAFGFPGLETTLPLLLTAAHNDKLNLNDITRLCHDNPAKIFGINDHLNTFIEVDENEQWTIQNENLKTKCKWSPYNDWKVKGKVKRVSIRGTKVYEDDTVLIKPGFGKIIYSK